MSVESASASSGTIAAVDRAVDVLMHFASSNAADLGVTEIAAQLGMPKGAVHRILTTLRSRGLLVMDPRTHRYCLGVANLRLGRAYLDRIDVRAMARPGLEELSRVTGETATLSVPRGTRSRVYVDQVLPDREVIMTVLQGEPYALHAGASSRAMLAFQSQARIETYLDHAELQRVTRDTIVDAAALRADLEQIRAQGWALSVAQRKEGAASVAAPVRDHEGHALAVVSVCGPSERFAANVDQCRDALLSVTRALSLRTGWDA